MKRLKNHVPEWTKRQVDPGDSPPNDEERKVRKSDRKESLRYWGIVALIFAMSLWVYSLTTSLKTDNHHLRTDNSRIEATAKQAATVAAALKTETETRSHNRTGDLVSSCRRGSEKSAATVNLYWLDYQAELLILAQRQSDHTSTTVPTVLAKAYFVAARENARTIDYRDISLLQLSTPLGSEQVPRDWVIKDHYNCNLAFQ